MPPSLFMPLKTNSIDHSPETNMGRQAILNSAFSQFDEEQSPTIANMESMAQGIVDNVKQLGDLEVSLLNLEACAQENSAGFKEITGVDYSPEAFSTSIKTAWQRIWEFIKALWRRFMAFIDTCLSNTRLAKFKLQRTRYRFSQVEGRFAVHGAVPMANLTRLLSIQGIPAGREDALDLGLKEFITEFKFIRDKYMPFVEHVGGKLEYCFNHQLNHPVSDREFLDQLNAAMSDYNFFQLNRFLPRTWLLSDPAFVNESARRGPHLLGGRTLAFIDGSKAFGDNVDKTPITMATAIQDSKIILYITTLRETPPAEMEIPPHHNLADWLEYIETLLHMVEGFLTDSGRARAVQHAKSMEYAINKIVEHGTSDSYEYRRALRYAQAYSVWVTSPTTEMSNHIVRVCDAALSLINRHIDYYKTHKS